MSITVVIEKTANINQIKKEMTFFLGANTMVKKINQIEFLILIQKEFFGVDRPKGLT